MRGTAPAGAPRGEMAIDHRPEEAVLERCGDVWERKPLR